MLMAAPKHQLRALLEQSCQMVEELASDSVKLVVEVQAIHYWTTHSLETLRQLKSIGGNLRSLLTSVDALLATPEKLHTDHAGQKLIRTVYGLWRALPGLAGKFTEQLSRRRRQRIMGIEPEDAGEIPTAQIEQEHAELRKLIEQVNGLYAELHILAGKIPVEVTVEFETEGGQPGETPAAPSPVQAEPQPVAQQPSTPDHAAIKPVAAPDEMSPV
jgi:hypothetical protein